MRGWHVLLIGLLAFGLSGCLAVVPGGELDAALAHRLADTAECHAQYLDGSAVDCAADEREALPSGEVPDLWACGYSWESPWGTTLEGWQNYDASERLFRLSGPLTESPAAGFIGFFGPEGIGGDEAYLYELGPGLFSVPADWEEVTIQVIETQVDRAEPTLLAHDNLDLRATLDDGLPWFVWAFPDPDQDITYTFSAMSILNTDDGASTAPMNLNVTGADYALETRVNSSIIGGFMGGLAIGPGLLERMVSGEC